MTTAFVQLKPSKVTRRYAVIILLWTPFVREMRTKGSPVKRLQAELISLTVNSLFNVVALYTPSTNISPLASKPPCAFTDSASTNRCREPFSGVSLMSPMPAKSFHFHYGLRQSSEEKDGWTPSPEASLWTWPTVSDKQVSSCILHTPVGPIRHAQRAL